MRALIVGRFQPPHKGHIQMLEEASKSFGELLIGLGSTNVPPSFENPFSFEQRSTMLSLILDDVISYEIKAIPDFNNPPKWGAWIRDNLDFDLACTNSKTEYRIFQDIGFKVRKLGFYGRDRLKGSLIRKKIEEGDDLSGLLDEKLIRYLSEIDAQRILTDLIKK